MRRNVLVVSTVDHAEELLRSHISEADTVKVVVPVVRQGFLDWLASDEKGFSRANEVAVRTAEELPGDTDDAVAGEADVGLAVRDALATFPADEILVVVHSEEERGLIESAGTASAPQHSVEGVPVRYLVIRED